MAAVYRYLAYDLRTLTLQAELPLSGVSYSQVLSQAGDISAMMPLNVQRQTAPGVYSSKAAELITATTPGRTLLCVERNGQLIEGYIIWTRTYDSAKLSCELGGKSIWSYFEHRFITWDDVVFTDADRLTIARTLITAAQAVAGGNVNVTVGSETCGVLQDATYLASEFKPVAAAVQELAAQGGGFDFVIEAAYAGGVPTFTLRLFYPRRGRGATDNGLVFETGRNIVSYTYPEDASTQANKIYGVGSGAGIDMVTSTQADTSLIDAGWPLLEAVESHHDETDQTNLDVTIAASVDARAQPVVIPSFTVRADIEPVLGAWIDGDTPTFVVGGNPDKPDPRWSSRTSLTTRVVGHRVTVGDNGQELVTMVTNGA